MNLAISNIAWDEEYDDEIYRIMNDSGIRGLEIAPTKIWDDIFDLDIISVQKFDQKLRKQNIRPIAMQSLLYGKPDLIIWGTPPVREKTINYLTQVLKIAKELEIGALVFGSPKNRIIPKELELKDAEEIAIEFFRAMADVAVRYQTMICIEPNPEAYGTNFLNTTREALSFVTKINHPGLKVNIDTGTISLNSEEDWDYLKAHSGYIGHVHISEPFLDKIDFTNPAHAKVRKLLRDVKYERWVSIEMKAQENLEVSDIEKILKKTQDFYS